MLKREFVTKVVNKRQGIYAPHVITMNGSAAIPNELLNEVEAGDQVTIFSSNDLSYGGYSAIVIETPTSCLNFSK